ncbi:hypothetical protein [uncultured Corynebacterium sp.]|uniref:hypothetical protein n=1 Tax=uncultured Corynebacterium sp. TaxID=159447 RepID=UPI0025F4F153|nr:hypothetical protein [uncultured Corynebacterium sp.]
MNILSGNSEAERKTLKRRCDKGELHRVRPNIYISADEWNEMDEQGRRRARHMTAVDGRVGSVIVGRSAALAWGLDIVDRGNHRLPPDAAGDVGVPGPRYGDDVVELGHPTRRRYENRGGVHERKLGWGAKDLWRIGGRPVTSVGATVADISTRHGFGHGLVAADSALRLGHSAIDLAAAANRSANPRQALRTVACASQLADSAAESLMRAQIIDAGLPAPELQLRVFGAGKVLIGYVDMGYPGFLAVVEVHGEAKFTGAYGDPEERSLFEWRRESELVAEGLAVMRVTWPEILSGEALRRLRETLERQRAVVDAGAETTAHFLRAGDRWPEGFTTKSRRRNGRS